MPPIERLRALATRQDMVASTAQCLEAGADPSWVDRQVRSGAWQRLHQGVLVLHSGPVPWRTHARAAVIYAGAGAALSHASAGYLHGFTSAGPRVIEVSVGADRYVRPSPGLKVYRRRTPPAASGRLPVVDRGETVLDLLAQVTSDDEAIALVCAAVRARTRPVEVDKALQRRSWLPRRGLVVDLLADAAEGIESALERRFHYDVERRHGLPHARLQVRHRVGGRWIRADRLYEDFGVRAELDGELAHPGGRTDSDVWRDNAVLIARDELTLRYRWQHVRGTPCRTAAQVAAALTVRGWTGQPRRCGPSCALP